MERKTAHCARSPGVYNVMTVVFDGETSGIDRDLSVQLRRHSSHYRLAELLSRGCLEIIEYDQARCTRPNKRNMRTWVPMQFASVWVQVASA